ncbi:hypothetical protein E1262_08440 [Jiangella aurantiaca]|uniref:Uncharacterized protein n=1 Tax=Jiangella aurantiaca TaxID=2530373 RepID=A0A4R5AGB8_9ACTN|nr:hypothetical protein [Jiangella aurantiaca]TDD70675.1 hypothetical protein E1262_08440 [Jiangella aurantiaca]
MLGPDRARETTTTAMDDAGFSARKIADQLAFRDVVDGETIGCRMASVGARQAAAELLQLVNVAQQAMWTPELLADVRERYLPGATDAEIIERLTRLAERDSGLELRTSGRLFPQDGQALTAAAHREKVERVAVALSNARVSITDLESVVGDLRTIHAATGTTREARVDGAG